MGNPLHRLFKKIFTGSQKKEDAVTEELREAAQTVETAETVEIMKAKKEIEVAQKIEAAENVEAVEVVEAVGIQEKTAMGLEQSKTSGKKAEVKVLRIEDYAEEDDESLGFEEEVELAEREIRDYIAMKAYEEKLIDALEEQGITKTSQISRRVVAYILGTPGMTESRARNFLSKFKGYISFNVASKLFTREEWNALEKTLDWRIHIQIQEAYNELKIKDVFKAAMFEPLCKLAKIKEISKLREITTAFLVSYKNYTGVGEKKYKKTLEILAKYAEKDSSFENIGIMQQEPVARDYEINLEPSLYELFNKYTLGQVAMIYGLEVEADIRNIKLKQLQGRSMNEASGLIHHPALENALKQMSQIIVPSLAFTNFNNTYGLEILSYRFEGGYSLEETAQKVGKTLEETSRLQKETLEELTEILRNSKFVEILTYLNKGDYHVAFKTVEEVLGEQNEYILKLIKYNAFHDLGYNPIFDMVFLHEEVGEAELMAALAEELPEVFPLSAYEKQIEGAIQNIGIKKWGKDVVPNLLNAMGYTASGKLYSKGDISISYILDMIFRDKVKKPLYLDEDAVEFLVEEAQKEYGYILGNNILTVERKIKGIQEILQVGSNTYLHSSRLKCKKELVEEIGKYLAELEKVQCKVNSNVVYQAFKDKLKGSSIQDQYGLYNMIFYYFGDRYKKEGEDSLNIILKEEKQEVGYFIGLEQVAPRLQQLINKHMDTGYIKTQSFLQEISEREELQEFLVTNHLEDYKVIAEVLKLVDDTLLGEDEFLYRVNSLYQSIEELEAAHA